MFYVLLLSCFGYYTNKHLLLFLYYFYQLNPEWNWGGVF